MPNVSDADAQNILQGLMPGENMALYVGSAAVARGETDYGNAWPGTNNWGAWQSGKPPCDPSTSVEHTDTHPNPDGTSTPYQVCFGIEPTPEAGAQKFLHILLKQNVLDVLRNPDSNGNVVAEDIATAMHDNGYFEGFGPTVDERILGYAKLIVKNANAISDNLGWDRVIFLASEMPPATGSTGGKVLAGGLLLGAVGLLFAAAR